MPGGTPSDGVRRPLRRSRRHRLVAGVCGGIAEWRRWNPTVVRVAFVLIGALPFLSGILVYLVLWLLIPPEEQDPKTGDARAGPGVTLGPGRPRGRPDPEALP
jgi:phage shock protein C